MKDDGVRKRNIKHKPAESARTDTQKKKTTVDKKHINSKESSWKIVDWFFNLLSIIVGVTAMLIISVKFSEYLEILHENELWFSNIKEIEREISFRTEQGLYYSFYKQLVNSKSLAQGLKSLSSDNTTESGHSINILQRFNIYPEVTVAFLYKYFNLENLIPAIFFYTKFVFYLNGLYVACIYLTTWSLGGTWIAGVLSVGLYILNLPDATRVHYTVPLRESFSGPFVFAQLTCLVLYLKNYKVDSKQYLWLLLNGIFTFLFTMSWQFGQFILLLQSIVLFMLSLTSIISYSQMQSIFMLNEIVMLVNYALHHNQSMIVCSLVVTFIPVTVFTTSVQTLLIGKNLQGFFKNLILYIFHLGGVLVLTVLINSSLKVALNVEADDHIFKFLKSKLFFEESREFETRLYLCNGAFNYMDWDTVARLWSRLLLPLYLPVEFILLLSP